MGSFARQAKTVSLRSSGSSLKMKSYAFVLLLVTLVATGSADVDIEVHDGNANDYAGEILKNLRVAMKNTGLDPLILPIKSLEFSKKVLGMELRGSAKVYDGFLKGFSTVHRTGLALMTSPEATKPPPNS